jgi:hypothetical protein
LVESPAAATRRAGLVKTARLQQAFAALGKPVILLSVTVPWPQGSGLAEGLATPPFLPLYRLPSYSPDLNGLARFWSVLWRRATLDRLFGSMVEWRAASLRNCRRDKGSLVPSHIDRSRYFSSTARETASKYERQRIV